MNPVPVAKMLASHGQAGVDVVFAVAAIAREQHGNAQPWMVCALTGMTLADVTERVVALVDAGILGRSDDEAVVWVKRGVLEDTEDVQALRDETRARWRALAPRMVTSHDPTVLGTDDPVALRRLVLALYGLMPHDPFAGLLTPQSELLADVLDVSNAVPAGDPAATARPWRS